MKASCCGLRALARAVAISVGLLLAGSLPALADPIVKPGPQPGAALEWRAEGNTVVLVIDERYDPYDIATAIIEGLPRARAKVQRDQVVVTGVALPALLDALSKMEAEPLLDDVDSMLQALQAGGDPESDSGSSIRATKNMSLEDLLGPPSERLVGTVRAVHRGKFPLVLVTIRITRAPERAEVGPKQTITVVPRVPHDNGRVSPVDAQSQLNIGAWYAQPGDRVEIRLGKKGKKVWFVDAYRRVKP